MKSDAHKSISARPARPIHYVAVLAPLLLFAGLIAAFGPRIALKVARIGLLLVCTTVGVYSLDLAVIAYQAGVVRSGLGLITRAAQPGRFWMLLWLQILIGPLLIAICFALTWNHWW